MTRVIANALTRWHFLWFANADETEKKMESNERFEFALKNGGRTTKFECHILIKCFIALRYANKSQLNSKRKRKKHRKKWEPFKQFILKWCGWGFFAGYDAFQSQWKCVEKFECISIFLPVSVRGCFFSLFSLQNTQKESKRQEKTAINCIIQQFGELFRSFENIKECQIHFFEILLMKIHWNDQNGESQFFFSRLNV